MTKNRLCVAVALFAFSCGGSATSPTNPLSGTGLQAGAPWPMFRHDLHHSGRSAYEGPRAPQVRWRFTPPPPDTLDAYCPPVIAADGTIYVASSTGVNAVTPEGTLKWRFPLGERCQGSPLIAADGTIYVGGAILHALTPEGTERWKFQPMVDELGGAPAIASDGTVYVCSEGYGLHALAPDGSLRWTLAFQPSVKTSPAVADDGTIYLAAESKILGVSPSGQKKWEAPISRSQGVVPMVAKDGVILAASDQTLAAFSPAGTPLWNTAIPELLAKMPPALADDGNLWISTWHALFRYGPDGSLRQRLEAYSLSLEMPLVDSQGVAYFAGPDCTLHAVDRDGNEKWTLATSVPSCGSPVMDAKGTLYFTSPSGGLIAVGDAPGDAR